MIDNKYKFTGDIDSITFKGGNPLDAYLPDGTKLQVQDMGNYYAYSNGLNLWRIPKSKFEGEQLKKGPAEDIDKVMLGTLAMGLGPIALPELFGPLVTNIVNNPQMWGQALLRTAAGMAGYEGVNEINKAVNNETWGEGVHRLSKGRVPVWLGDLTNPGGTLEGVITNTGNRLLNLTIKTPLLYLKFNPDAMYRIIGEAGYRDALQSGVLRPNMDPTSKYYRGINKTYNWFTKGHPNDRKHPVIFSNGKMPIDRVYPGDVIVEVLPLHPLFSEFKPHLEDAGIYKIEPRLSINSPYIKFYKYDKKGYVPYPLIINSNSNNLLTNIWLQISKSTAPFLLYREISRSTPQIPIKLETSLYLKPSTETSISKPYVRWSLKGYLNEAQDVYLTLNPNLKFLIVKDVDNPLVGVFNNLGNGLYSLHFHTKREGFTPELKDAMFTTLADQIPEGGIVSTWGNVSKGGFHALRRFENLFNWPWIGARVNGLFIGKNTVSPFKAMDLHDNPTIIPVYHKPTVTLPFTYDSLGNLVYNPNYFYRTGWGIVDDALNSGVIRVPEGDYKPAILLKYPFLNDNNPFSTMKISHKFPYFSDGSYVNKSYSTALVKHDTPPPLPEDLIAIPKDIPGVLWSGAGKWSDLLPNKTPTETGGRGTPLINGETNKFPTNKAELFRLNENGLYIPVRQIKGSYGIDDLHIITKPEEVTQITRLQSDSPIPHTSNSHFNAGYWIRQDPSKLISLKEIPNLQETIDYILKNTNLVRLEFLDSNYINGFRNIAQLQGINVSFLSNEDIAKILTELYEQLSNTSSGLLKDNVFWRTWGRYKPQDYFDWLNHLGELTKNEGFWGSGNYFASGRMAVHNIPSNNNPYMIRGITEIGYDDLLGATNAAGDATRSGELAGAELANTWMNESPNTRLVAATPKGMRNRYGWIDDNQYGIEVVTKKNSEIKSLYPDLRNGNGQTFVRDWSNPNTFLFSTEPVQRFEGTQETSIHPLEARLARLREKVKEGVIPETKLLGLIGKDLTPMDIKSALIELDPTLTDKLIQGAVLVAMAKKLGVHIPFGTENTTDAGLSIVDIADAVKLLKKHNITNPTSKDIENIIAHEFGHSTAYEIPEDVRPLLQGYYDPNEFFTLAGLILDNAGIKETVNNPVSYKDFMDMLAQYQSQGNLDNGISLLADFMKLFSATSGNRWKDASTIVKRNQLMKYINRLSAGLYGAYLLRNRNGKTLQ